MLNPYIPFWSILKRSADVDLKIHRFNLVTSRDRMFDLYSDAMHVSQFHMPDVVMARNSAPIKIKFDHAFIIIPKVKIAEKKLIDMIEFFSSFHVKNLGQIHLFMVNKFNDKNFTLVDRIPVSYINYNYKLLRPPKYWINYYKTVVRGLDDVYKRPLKPMATVPFGTNSWYEYEMPPTLYNPENNADINKLNAFMVMIFRMSDVMSTLYAYKEEIRARTESYAPFVKLVLDMYESRGMNTMYGNASTLDLLTNTVLSSNDQLEYILDSLNQILMVCAPTSSNLLPYMITRNEFRKKDLLKLSIPTNAFELNDLQLTDIQYEQRLTQAKLLKDAVNSAKEENIAQSNMTCLKLSTDFARVNQTLQSHLTKTCADKVDAHLIAGNELSQQLLSNDGFISEYMYDKFTVNKYIIVTLKSPLINVWKFTYKERSMLLHVPGSDKLHQLILFIGKYKLSSGDFTYITILRADYHNWDITIGQQRGQTTINDLTDVIDNDMIIPEFFVYEEVDRHSEKYKNRYDTERRYNIVWDMYKEHEAMRMMRELPAPAPAPAPEPVPAPEPEPVLPVPTLVPEPRKKSRSRSRSRSRPRSRSHSRSRSRPRSRSRSRSRSKPRPVSIKTSISPKKAKVEKRKKSKKSKKNIRNKKEPDGSLEKLMKSLGLYPRGKSR